MGFFSDSSLILVLPQSGFIRSASILVLVNMLVITSSPKVSEGVCVLIECCSLFNFFHYLFVPNIIWGVWGGFQKSLRPDFNDHWNL